MILKRFTHSVSGGLVTGGIVFVSEIVCIAFFVGSMRTFRTSLTSEPGARLKRYPSPASMCAQIVWPSLRLNLV